MAAGALNAAIVADAMYTMLCLARKQFDAEAVRKLQTVELAERIPLEAENLAFPQSQFFGKPFWGHALLIGISPLGR